MLLWAPWPRSAGQIRNRESRVLRSDRTTTLDVMKLPNSILHTFPAPDLPRHLASAGKYYKAETCNTRTTQPFFLHR